MHYFFRLTGSFILGYLFIKWFPEIESAEASGVITELVLHPVEFFASSIMFIFGFIVQGSLVKAECLFIIRLSKGNVHKELLIVPVHACMIYGLSMFGIWETLFFSFLAVFYGIISLDLRRQGGHHA
ncbi:hypothetical protein ACQ0QQ_09855 [Lysinibacillus sphaericus]